MTNLSRRSVLIGSLAVMAAAGVRMPTASAAPVDDRIADLERRNNASIGIYAVDLDSNRTVAHRADDSFAMCSTFKAYLAARILRGAERGELSLDDRVYVSTNDVGIAYGPQGQRILLALMVRTRGDDPNADGFRPLIGELTALVLPELGVH